MSQSATSTLAGLRSGAWLTRRRVRIGAALLVAIELGFFVFFVAGTHGWIVPLDADDPRFRQLLRRGYPCRRRHSAARLRPPRALGGRRGGDRPRYPVPVFQLPAGLLARLRGIGADAVSRCIFRLHRRHVAALPRRGTTDSRRQRRHRPSRSAGVPDAVLERGAGPERVPDRRALRSWNIAGR